MGYIVLAAWAIQAAVGVTLLVSWARHAKGESTGLVVTHALMMVAFLTPWTVFLVTGTVLWAWTGLAVLALFIGFGDATMVRRARVVLGASNPGLRDYLPAIRVGLSGAFGGRVRFHLWFSALVFFPCLAVCIIATVAG